MEKLRIGIFFHRFDGGGAEKMTVVLANELARQGHTVTILIRHDKGPVRRLLDSAVQVRDMKLPEEGKLRKNWGNIRFLRRALRPGTYDVMMSITAEMSQVAALSTWFLHPRIPLVSVVHSTLSQEVHSFQRVREFLFPIVNRRYDRVITVSEAVRKDYIRVCKADPNRVKTVYNPVIDEKFRRHEREEISHPWLAADRKFTVLVLAGRLCAAKNHGLMLEALKLLNRQGDYRLLLLGDGELRQELEQRTRELGLERQVEFAGFIENPAPFLKQADAVVLSSRFEGLPTVLIEALAVGARIVSTDCPSGPREILADGKYGVLVPPGDPRAFADGVVRALAQEPDRDALRMRAQDFTAERSAAGYLQVLWDAVGKEGEPCAEN